MKLFIYRTFALLTLVFAGCIENDIPLPIVKGDITEIKFEGQLAASLIDSDNRTIDVELDETTDITNVSLLKFKVTENTTVTPHIGELPVNMDLSKDVILTLETYQKYIWTIRTTQFIDRKVEATWLVSEDIDTENHTVVIYATANAYKNRSNLDLGSLVLGSSVSETTPLFSEVKDFTDPVEFTVTTHNKSVVWTVTVEKSLSDVVTDEKPSKVRAYYAILAGKVASDGGDDVGFEYKKKGDEIYTKVNSVGPEEVVESRVYKEIETEPGTTYLYRIFQGESVGTDVEFITDPTPDVIPNLSFDDWYSTGSRRKTYFPFLENEPYWITGNEGVTIAANSNVTPSDDAVEGKAARLESVKFKVIIVGDIFAAGTLYTGAFKTNMGNPNLSAILGREFNGRPDKFSGKYKYTPKEINNVGSGGDSGLLGTMDKCHMYVSLENWGGETVRPESPTIVAYGEFIETETITEYTDFEIVLDYKTEEVMPTHINILFSSSFHGETYTIGIGSLLFIDELKVIY